MPVILLAQNAPQAANVPPLPSPPIVSRLLYEHPLPLVALLVVGAVIAFMVFSRRSKAKEGIMAAAALLLTGLGLWVLATFVQTDRELIMAETAKLVGVTVRANSAALDEMLAPDVRLFAGSRIPSGEIPTSGMDKAAILDAIPQFLKKNTIEEAAVLEMQGILDGPTSGRTQARIRTTWDKVPVLSWWRVTWRRGSDGRWTVTAIEPLEVGIAGMPGFGGM